MLRRICNFLAQNSDIPSYTTRKIVSEMTYNVSSGMLKPTIPILLFYSCYTNQYHILKYKWWLV